MEVRVLDAVPFPIDMDSLAKQLRIREGSGHLEKLEKLADQARAVGKPKVVFRAAYIEERSEDRVRVNGVLLSSRVLRVNLDKAHRVFPYVATCGAELEEWSQGVTDLLEKFWADAIKEMAVKQTVRYLNEYLTESFQPGRLSRMNPGSSRLASLRAAPSFQHSGGRTPRHRGPPDRPFPDDAHQVGFRDLVSHRGEL